jgi:tRNA1(Val) A37 N6-methylase TrmN6
LDDCVKLDKIIKKYKIKNILELGTGIGSSTLSMAYSLPPDGHIDTVEQFEKCIERAKQIIPKKYKDKITFYRSEAEIFQPFKYLNTLAYKELPRGDWDLIVIDGPSFQMEGDYLITSLPRGDIIRLIETLKDKTFIYIDGSLVTRKLLKRFYSHCVNHNRKEDLFQKISLCKSKDSKLETLKNYGFI